MRSLCLTIILSVAITFSSANNVCTDLFAKTVENLQDFRTNFLSPNFGELSNNLENINHNVQAIQETCGEFTAISSDTLPREPLGCSHLYTLINSLMQDTLFDSIKSISLPEELPFILEDIVDFTLQIRETDCVTEWRMNFGEDQNPIHDGKAEFEPPLEDIHQDVYFEILFDEADVEGEVLGVFVGMDSAEVDCDAAPLVLDDVDGEPLNPSLESSQREIIETEDGEAALGVFVPVDIAEDLEEDQDQEDIIVFVPYHSPNEEEDDSLSVYVSLEEIRDAEESHEDPEFIEVENGEDALGVFVSASLAEEPEGDGIIEVIGPMDGDEEDDSISVYVPMEEIIENESSSEGDEDDSLVVFVPYYSNDEEEDSVSVYVPLEETLEIEDQEDLINVVVIHNDENDEDALGVFVPLLEL